MPDSLLVWEDLGCSMMRGRRSGNFPNVGGTIDVEEVGILVVAFAFGGRD